MTTIFIICMLFSLIVVLSIISQINAQRKCPDERTLRKVILGSADKNSFKSQAIIEHLGICEKCRQRIEDMNEVNWDTTNPAQE